MNSKLIMMNNSNGFKQDLLHKYIQLGKDFLSLQNKIKLNNQTNSYYKTELCKTFLARGYCPYGKKCRFAHGKEELICKIQGVNYKKEKCKSFYGKGFCQYGYRCQFQHDERKFKDINISYLYLRFFLFKYSGFIKRNPYYFEKNAFLYYERLPVFESLTHYCKIEKNMNSNKESGKYIIDFSISGEKSLSSKSNNSIDDTTYSSDKLLLKEVYDDINNISEFSH